MDTNKKIQNNKKEIIPFKKANKNIKNIIGFKHSYLINIIIIQYILFLLPENILATDYDQYITLKVTKAGLNQVISSEYNNILPSKILVNEEEKILVNKKVFVYDKDAEIKLIWNTYLTSISYMFSNLNNIKSIYMYYMYQSSSTNMSYFCYNCFNLEKFTYSISYGINYAISDMRNMFYNCYSLTSFDFSNLYLNYYYSKSSYSSSCECTIYNYYYNYINMSYMFYNCYNLSSVIFSSSNRYGYISDMRYMFYNCTSLLSINIQKFFYNTNVNASYMFYNCQKLTTVYLNSSFPINDMRFIFYNCKSLNYLDSFSIYYYSSSYINMSYAFKNCEKLSTIPSFYSSKYISDTREMFYNCKSFKTGISFSIYYSTNYINMSKMFYNCQSIETIRLSQNNYFYPNDLNAMFYNCTNLKSLYLNDFYITYVLNTSYMFYNCLQLSTFSYYTFSKSLIKDMRGMFQNCESLITLNINYFYSYYVEVTWDMFKGCKKLQSLSMSYFYTANVTDMESMFEGCSSLTSLYLNNFNTSKVLYMNKMFKNCYKLEYLYLHNFQVNSLGTMHQMFYNCASLKYLDIFSIAYEGQSIHEMFEGTPNNFTFCVKENENIPYIFDILFNKTEAIRDCSSGCYYSGNRIGIYPKKLCCANYIYNNSCYNKCPGRTTISSSSSSIYCTAFNCTYFYNYPQTGCISDIPTGYYLNDTQLKTIDICHNDCRTCSAKENSVTTNCLSCKNNNLILYLGNCIEDCGDLGSYNDPITGIKKCKCSKEKCQECSVESLELDLCVTCSSNFYPKSDEPKYLDKYVNCYNNPPKYYLGKNSLYEPCYNSCETCSDIYTSPYKNHHYCYKCNSKYSFALPMESNSFFFNCYINCSYFFYFDEDDNYTCTIEDECPDEYNLLIEEKRQCVKSCPDNYPYEFRKKCYNVCPKNDSIIDPDKEYKCKANCPFEKPFEIVGTQMCVSSCTIMQRYDKLCITNYNGNRIKEVQDMIINDIQNDIVDTFNFSFVNEERSLVLEENKVNYEITTTKTKRFNPKTSKINFAQCETILKTYYDINSNESLYIFKIDAFVEELSNPKVEYQVYFPLTGFFLHPLDLTMCEGKELILGFTFNGTKEEEMFYDKNSRYYNDICFPFTSKKNTDISLEDRQQEYINNNMSLCDEDCRFKGFDEEGDVECICEIKFNLPLVSQITIDKTKLYKFINIKNIINFNVLKCHGLLFSKKGILLNIGFYTNIPSIVLYFVCIVIFYKKSFKLLKRQINEIIFARRNEKYLYKKKVKKEKIKIKKDYKSIFEHFIEKKKLDIENKSDNNKVNININIKKNNINNYITLEKKPKKRKKVSKNKEDNNKIKQIELNNINFPPIKKSNIEINKTNGELNEEINNKLDNEEKARKEEILGYKTSKNDEKKKFTPQQKEQIKNILQYNEKELNDLEYKSALKYDSRSYIGYYLGLLKNKHPLFRIFNKTDYNSRIIKIFLFVYRFSSSYGINALFFNDKTMHKIYEDAGKFDFIYQIPKTIYTLIISSIIDFFVEFFALSQKNILLIKHEPKVENVGIKAKSIIKLLEIKFRIFFIISFIILILYWYYLSCFCAVYQNTQKHLIINTVLTFGESMLNPLGISLFPGIFRIPSLKKYSKGRKIIYHLSKLIQLI